MPETGEALPPAGLEADPRVLWSPEVFRTLAYASAIGGEFDFVLLANALEREPETVAEQLERLVRDGVLRERPGGDRFSFIDEALRGRIYRSLAESRVRVIHGRVALAMERATKESTPAPTAELGRHFFLGRQPQKSLTYNLEAARQAKQELRREEAIHHLERARSDLLQLGGERTTELIQISEELGTLYQSVGDFRAAERAYETALRHLPPEARPSRARLLLARAEMAWDEVRPKDAKSTGDEALALFSELHDLEGAAAVHRMRSRMAAEKGDAVAALDEAMQAFELLRQTGTPGAAGKAGLELASAFARLGPEMQEEAAKWYDRAIRLLESSGDEVELIRATLLLADLVGARDPNAALEHLAKVRAIAERAKEPRWEGWSYLNGTEFRLRRGEIEEAERETRLAARLLERASDLAGAPAVQLSLGLIAARKGQWETAEEEFRRSAERARELGLTPQRAEAEFRLAEIRFKSHELEGAREAFRAAQRHRLPLLRPSLARAFKELGRDIEQLPAAGAPGA
jgi:tetratricopeptide (TPR) repeat protein